jgi:hypothetical protein
MELQPEETILSDTQQAPQTQNNALSPEEAELRSAQERLDQARKKKAEADEQKLIAARTAVLQRQAAEEKALADQREMQRHIEEKWAAKRKAEAEAEEAERRKAAQEKLELENLLAAQELAKQKRDAHDKEVRRLSDEAFALENAARQAEADALRMSAPAEEVKPVTIHSPEHPLSRIFGVTQPDVPEQPPAPAQAEPVQIELRKENPEERSVLMNAFVNKGLRVNPITIINLTLRHEPSPILHALDIVTADGRLQGVYAVQAIEIILWNPERDAQEVVADVIKTRESDQEKQRAEKQGGFRQ